jgi:ubiquinone biosynthesis protein
MWCMTLDTRRPVQEAFAQAAAFFGNTDVPQAERISNLLALLQSSLAPQVRQQLGGPVLALLEGDDFVPDAYLQWRALVEDALRYTLLHMSARRLATKLVEQFELPVGTSSEIRLVRFIGKMPGFQKLGQVLARNRNLRPSLRAVLTKLENSIADATAEEIRGIIADQLGSRLEACIVEIDTELLSEATVSAVVRFTARNPRSGKTDRGVFKVLKPHVISCFAEDMQLLQDVAEYLELRHEQYGIAANVLLDTFSGVRRLLEHEIDFAREQETLRKAAALYSAVAGVRTPRLMPHLCAAHVTAMTEERGAKITEAAEKLPPWKREQIAARLVECLIAVPLFGRAASAFASDDYLSETMFHGDPHAGNLLYDRASDNIVVLDWALTDQLSYSQRRHVALLLIMFVLRDPAGMYRALTSLALPQQSSGLPASAESRVNAEQAQIIRGCIHEALAQLSWTALPGLIELTRLLDRLALEGVVFPSSLLIFRKVLFTLDGILHEIAGAQFSIDFVVARYLVRRSMLTWPAAALPLFTNDWLAVNWSAMSYGSRMWTVPMRSLLERSRSRCAAESRSGGGSEQHCV